jgi:formate-dependent nitrite reductase membrane component NrfD
MNDVLNSQGYTQAAWWNRIPIAAWIFILGISVCCNLLLGFATRHAKPKVRDFLLLVLPLVLAISFLLLADIDSPRGGLIRVRPQNLLSLAESLHH